MALQWHQGQITIEVKSYPWGPSKPIPTISGHTFEQAFISESLIVKKCYGYWLGGKAI